MRERLAHFAHRQRFADRGFYEPGYEPVVDGAPFLLDPDFSDDRRSLR